MQRVVTWVKAGSKFSKVPDGKLKALLSDILTNAPLQPSVVQLLAEHGSVAEDLIRSLGGIVAAGWGRG